MEKESGTLGKFMGGLTMGALGALAAGLAIIYLLNMSRVVSISVISVPNIQGALAWAYENLRLSVIPFFLTFVLYGQALLKLRRYLVIDGISPEKISQAEHLVDMWINIFFGIGVIWTAIGMRSALLEALGGLDAATAAREGAFSILQRLVDGGILLALSTTIFGAVGGYAMRLVKALWVGGEMQAHYGRLEERESGEIRATLKTMERHLFEIRNNFETAVKHDPGFTGQANSK